MTRHPPFLPGIDILFAKHPDWIRGKHIGLVSHTAAVDVRGHSTAERLHTAASVTLVALFGPEHGFFGDAGAGEKVRHLRHPVWRIPVHSLYGAQRRPAPRMLRGVDVLLFDMQCLCARPYTYLGTLRYVLEAAAQHGIPVIVADRPVPLPGNIDGPVTDSNVESFVAAAPIPMSYGMTPGEAALWMNRNLDIGADLRVAPMKGYRRQSRREADWPPWIPPSPGIVSWETACCYPATVAFEAFPHVDYGRGAGLPFQVIGARWLQGTELASQLTRRALPGVSFHPHAYYAALSPRQRTLVDGVRLVVTDPRSFQPIRTSVEILCALQETAGPKRLWRNARRDFFDALFGVTSVREALAEGARPAVIAGSWRKACKRFDTTRRDILLYP